MTTTAATLPSAPSKATSLAELWRRHRGWLWSDVAFVYLLTRAALVLIAQLPEFFPGSPNYSLTAQTHRGWAFTPFRLLDVWGRWDTGWYFDIVKHGYYANGDIRTVQSNLAFFPLYPYTVRALLAIVPLAWRTPGAILLMGILVSNAFLLGALVLLRQWVVELTGDAGTARRTILYLLLFPAGFFFSAMYTESTFLFFVVAALFAAHRRAWFWACLAGALLTLSRPLGMLIGLPLAWQYAEQAGWNIRNLRWNVLWFGLIPAALLAFCYWQYALTGDFLAAFHAHEAWGRGFAWPWQTFFNPIVPVGAGYMTPIEQVLTLLFVAGALLAFWRLPSPSLGLYGLLLVMTPLFTGELSSTTRFYAVAVPVFVVAAQLGRHPKLDRIITLLLPMLQALLFFLWCLFYWVA